MKTAERAQVAMALRAAAEALMNAGTPKLAVFDCDETLLVSQGSITVKKADGETITMSSAAFAHFKPSPGDQLDFGAFNHIRKPRKIKKTFDKFLGAIKAGARVVILTARAKGAVSSIQKFLKHEGVDPDKVEVVALASSNPYDKAKWIDKAIEDGGHTEVEFDDDSHANANAVAEHGKKFHGGIKFVSNNVPHPHEEDFEGPALNKDFDSDDPSKAVVDFKPKPGESSSDHKPGRWWDRQSETFQKKYCEEHTHSKYC